MVNEQRKKMQSSLLDQFRAATGKSDKQLAEFLGLGTVAGPRTVRRWRAGQSPMPYSVERVILMQIEEAK